MSPQDQKNNGEFHKIDRVGAILSMNRALWLEVSPALRAAKIHWDDQEIHLSFYYDGEISDDDCDSAQCVGTEVISDYPDYQLKEDILRWDYPKPIPQGEGEIVYLRREKAAGMLYMRGLMSTLFGEEKRQWGKKKSVLSEQEQTPKSDDEFQEINYTSAVLSMNTALLGSVSPALRAAMIQWKDKEFHLYFYYDGEISEEDRESAECVAEEVISDFPRYKVNLDIVRLDYPKPIPQEDRKAVYRRREEYPPTSPLSP